MLIGGCSLGLSPGDVAIHQPGAEKQENAKALLKDTADGEEHRVMVKKEAEVGGAV